MYNTLLATLVLGLALISQNVSADTQTGTTSVFSKNQKFDNEGVELYNSNLEMKAMKKIGIGFTAGGMIGMIGINGEVNIEPENSLFLGLGTGKGFNTFNFGYKKNFEGYYMSPYTKVGYSQWYNSSTSNNGSARNSDILRRVLSDDEIQNNKFNVSFLAGGAGLEYNQLEGDLSGLNLFGELLVMMDASSFTFLPTGSIGLTYFY